MRNIPTSFLKIFRRASSEKAFTLLEVLLYFAIASTLVVLMGVTLSAVLQARVKAQAIADVDEAGAAAMQVITQNLRNAQSITSPAAGASSSTLIIQTYSSGSPTIFNISGGALQIQENGGLPVSLTTDTVAISGLNFTNLSRPNTPGTIRVQFTASRVNPLSKKEFSYTQTFYGTGTLRQP